MKRAVVYFVFNCLCFDLCLGFNSFATAAEPPVASSCGLKMKITYLLNDLRYRAFVSRYFSARELRPIEERTVPFENFNPQTQVQVAAIQWSPSCSAPTNSPLQAEAFKQANREALATKIREAATNGAKIIVTPEFGITHYPGENSLTQTEESWTHETLLPFAETVPGPTTNYFSGLAKELGVYLHIGFAEVDRATGLLYNALVALGPDGQIVAHHRKVNLFKTENQVLTAGDHSTSYDTPYGKVGLMICADSYCLPLLKNYQDEKVDILVVSAYWTKHNAALTRFRVAARTLRMPIVAANQMEFPESGVILKNGEIQSRLRQSSGIAYGYLPKRDCVKSLADHVPRVEQRGTE